MIEFKTETGTQKPEQKDWEEIITKQGFEYHIIRSFEQFQQLIWQNINQPNAQ
jgi:hypothetical protein